MNRISLGFFFTFVLLFESIISNSNAEIVINELMAYNVSSYPDIWDYKEFPDWIELYNNADSTVNLTGYYLTDRINVPRKWAIPPGTSIKAKGFLIFCADGHDAKPGDTATRSYYPFNIHYKLKRFHTNFKLNDQGEKIGLFKRIGNSADSVILVDTITFTRQLPDISIGRSPADGKWYKYDSPTPGGANATTPKPLGLIVNSPAPTFSIPAGYYSSGQTVRIAAAKGSVIYYTMNGSIPYENNAMKYDLPIAMNSNTVLRARCIDPNALAGSVETNTYFIGERAKSMMTVSISADSALLWDSANGTGIDRLGLKGQQIPASFEFFTPDGKKAVGVNAGLAIGSLTNYKCPQKPWQVTLSNDYGDGVIPYQLFDKPGMAFVKLRLRNGGDAWANNFMADALIQGIANGQLNNANQAYRPVVTFINGKYWGVQDMREQADDQYFIDNFNIDPTTLNDVRTSIEPPTPGHEGWEIVKGTWDDRATLMSLVNNSLDDRAYNKVQSMMDINSFIDFICLEDYSVNISWGHNQEMWKINQGKWKWLLVDFDRAFQYKNVNVNMLNTRPPGGISPALLRDTLFDKLMMFNEFRNRFLQRFAAHLNSTFSATRINALIDSMHALLAPEMEEHCRRWKAAGGLPSVQFWNEELDSMKAFATLRPDMVFSELLQQFSDLDTTYLIVLVNKTNAGEIHIENVRMCAERNAMKFFKNIPVHLKAIAKPGYVFTRWEGLNAITDTVSLTLSENKFIQAIFDSSEEHIIPSTISADMTLHLTDHSYVAQGDISIERGATLTVTKGVTIDMAQNAGLYVKGKLFADGSSDAGVFIRSHGGSGSIRWAGICFDSAQDTSVLSYVTVTGASLGKDAVNQKAAINGNYSSVIMDHLNLPDADYPMYFEHCPIVILRNSNIIIAHICNGGIHVGRGPAIIEHCTWTSTNRDPNSDAIDLKGNPWGIVRDNRIYNFNGFNSDGIDLGEAAVNIVIDGNYIFGNNDKGISCGGKSTCRVTNNIIVECDMGIGIKDLGSRADLDHNTFVRNRHGIEVYEKFYPRGEASATVRNTIFSGSKISSFNKDSDSSLAISYCLSDMDILPGMGNLFGNPRFIDPLRNNFQVSRLSPCIHGGDPNSPRNTDGSRTDIGAAYAYDTHDFPHPECPDYSTSVVINEIMYSTPQFVKSKDWIELYNPGQCEVDISKWKLTDNDYPKKPLWSDIPTLPAIENGHVFTIPSGTKLSAGGYLVLCKNIDDFTNTYPGIANYCADTLTFGIGDSERLALYNVADSLITAVHYVNTDPWPASADGTGSSLELKNPANYNHLTINWDASKAVGGTPGRQNSVFDTSFGLKNKPVMPPDKFSMIQNFPNPCKFKTTIMFALPFDDHVQMNIYGLNGRKLETLIDSDLPPGIHRIIWDTRKFSSGIYFYRIKSTRYSQIMKANVRQ